MSSNSIGLDDRLQQYLLSVSLREPDLCRELRQLTAEMPESMMISSPEQVQFLAFMAKVLDARNILEVGTFTGYTSLRLCLDLPQIHFTCCDISKEFTDIAQGFWQRGDVHERIDLQLAPAENTLNNLIKDGKENGFDMDYIDADKEGYRDYVTLCTTLVRPGGIIALDNTLWSGSVADPENSTDDTVALRELNSWLSSHTDYDLSLLPIGDGLTLLRVR